METRATIFNLTPKSNRITTDCVQRIATKIRSNYAVRVCIGMCATRNIQFKLFVRLRKNGRWPMVMCSSLMFVHISWLTHLKRSIVHVGYVNCSLHAHRITGKQSLPTNTHAHNDRQIIIFISHSPRPIEIVVNKKQN